MLDASRAGRPHAEALVEVGGERISYQQLWDRAARVAGGLREAGINPGDRVAIRLPNSIDWMLAFFGGLMAGAVVVPVNTRLTETEAAYVIGDSGSGCGSSRAAPLPDGPPFVHEGAAGPRTSPRSSTPAGPPGSPRAPCTRTRTCWRTWRPRSG